MTNDFHELRTKMSSEAQKQARTLAQKYSEKMRPAPNGTRENQPDSPLRWLGIDFSGNARNWSRGCTTSNIWIAEIVEQGQVLFLENLGRVQTLPGSDTPFECLVARLQARDFCAAAIDAPFSVPAEFIPDGGHKDLLALVRRIPQEKRPFPDGRIFANTVIRGHSMISCKPLRRTEREWQSRGINVRSTLWSGARSGAAMTAACLALLSATQGHLWPWSQYKEGIIAEAFPAAQLKTWQLPYQRYSDSTETAVANRQQIARALKKRVTLGRFESHVLNSADALDAVLCAFAAIAIGYGTFIPIPVEDLREEGWIAVHL